MRSCRTALAILLVLFPCLAFAADYDVRNFANITTHMYRNGPNLTPVLVPGTSLFMGVHFRQTSRSAEPHPLLTVADSVVGPHRYMRLDVFGQGNASTPGAINFVAKTLGNSSGGTSVAGLSVGSAVTLNQWYAAGVLIEAKASGWKFTIFKQAHGGSIELSAGSLRAQAWLSTVSVRAARSGCRMNSLEDQTARGSLRAMKSSMSSMLGFNTQTGAAISP